MIYCAWCFDQGLKIVATHFCETCAVAFCDTCAVNHNLLFNDEFKATKIPEEKQNV